MADELTAHEMRAELWALNERVQSLARQLMDEVCDRKRWRAEICELRKQVEQMRAVLHEVSLEPYPDSDLASLLETLRERARGVL